MIFIGHEVSHPSFISLLPVLGTCLFIMFSHQGDVSNDVMSLKPVVGIGLISYSLYLWHQPVFVFFRFIKHDYFRYEQFVLLALISFVFAVCSYFFVEKPFRKKRGSKGKVIVMLSVLLLLFAFNFFVQENRGYPERLGAVVTLFKDLNDNSTFKIGGVRCFNQSFDKSCRVMSDQKNVLLLGDSHAGSIGRHLYNESLKQGMGYIHLTPSNCTGINTVRAKQKVQGEVLGIKPCEVASEKISAYLESPVTPRMKIVFVARLPLYLSGKRFDNGLGGLEPGGDRWIEAVNGGSAKQAVIDKLSFWASLGHELVLVYPIPEIGWHVPRKIQQILGEHVLPSLKKEAYDNLKIGVHETTYQERTSEAFDLLDNVEGENVSRVYPHKVFCTEGHCKANDATSIYYYDDDHLSTHGAKLLVNEIAKHLP
ncbi:acyltransferase family protein [Vibrio sp. Isolate24]|uniref:acyltransferase family protein n=1 Tax=Vibrio sp. Isolate24 TaxID=2908534 RepID=UPI001EFC9A6F|nr:acyltransferase family protein [Vibrio sp. Isolate24]MCG9677574.1 acyltransferase [Vibrio sp. Isolate24]